MIKRWLFTVLVVVTLVLAAAVPAAAQTLAQETVEVRISIPAMHTLEVVDAPVIEFDVPDPGESKEFYGVGKIRMQSNAPWTLNVDTVWSRSPAYDVEVRPSNSGEAWQQLNALNGATFSGQGGSHGIQWDIRIVPRSRSHAGQTESLTLGFTASLSQ